MLGFFPFFFSCFFFHHLRFSYHKTTACFSGLNVVISPQVSNIKMMLEMPKLRLADFFHLWTFGIVLLLLTVLTAINTNLLSGIPNDVAKQQFSATFALINRVSEMLFSSKRNRITILRRC